jgi:hypothetical protein
MFSFARLEKYFMTPDKKYEITGQVNQVCFLEGLTFFNNRWLLYYGTVDSKIAVAEYSPLGFIIKKPAEMEHSAGNPEQKKKSVIDCSPKPTIG